MNDFFKKIQPSLLISPHILARRNKTLRSFFSKSLLEDIKRLTNYFQHLKHPSKTAFPQIIHPNRSSISHLSPLPPYQLSQPLDILF